MNGKRLYRTAQPFDKNHKIIPFEVLVELSGESSNLDVLDEFIKWGAMIEDMRSFSGGCDAFKK